MITLTQVIVAIVKILVMVGFLFNVGGLLTWVDRRQSAMIQDRVGPNRAVIKIGKFELRLFGLLHTAADGVKFFFKEDFMPPKADKLLFSIAPILAMVPVLALGAVIPMTDTLCLDVAAAKWNTVNAFVPMSGVCTDNAVEGAIAPLNIGILYVFAIAGQGIVGAAIAGWSSDNKFSLMGALRAASQMVSYEVAIGLSLVGAMMVYGTVRLDLMVKWQDENCWGIFVQPLAFFLFFIAAVAESKRIPFDLPEAESELVSGYFTEYSGMKFGMFYFAEYMEIVTSSMLVVTIFLGGWALPFLHRNGLAIAFGETAYEPLKIPHVVLIVIGVLTFFGKTLALCFIQAFVRWSLPRFRYDQLMKLGWRVLLPLALGNIFATGVITLGIQGASDTTKATFKLLADLSQGLVAVLLTVMAVRFVLWAVTTRRKDLRAIGTSAEYAKRAGGTKQAPMGA
jgi:NADH-quinone oxidoreductase subunit H